MDILETFGLGDEDLASQLGKEPPKVVQGRVAHIDADFIAYIIAADTRDEIDGIKPMRDLQHKYSQVHDFADTITRNAGASSYVLHITPPGSTKGGRPMQAVQQEYQATRKGKEPPVDLHAIRAYIGTECKAVVHLDQEADDGLAQANYGDPKNSIICSSDKDLLMVPGLHLNMKTGAIEDYAFDDFGKLWMDTSTSTATLKGYGPKFFFAQCLMGDSADNIKGLPGVPARLHYQINETKSFGEDLTKVQLGKKTYEWFKEKYYSKAKPCGPAYTLQLLDTFDNISDTFRWVRSMYNQYEKEHGGFTHWQSGLAVSANAVLLGEMQLLWMRRNKNPNDVVDWMKENVK